jgi:hypothetical protein
MGHLYLMLGDAVRAAAALVIPEGCHCWFPYLGMALQGRVSGFGASLQSPRALTERNSRSHEPQDMYSVLKESAQTEAEDPGARLPGSPRCGLWQST